MSGVEFHSMKVDELRQLCRDSDLPCSGRKSELITRLVKHKQRLPVKDLPSRILHKDEDAIEAHALQKNLQGELPMSPRVKRPSIHKSEHERIPDQRDAKRRKDEVGPSKVEPSKVELSKVESSKVEPSKVEPSKVESSKVEPSKVEPSKVEPSKVASGRDLVNTKRIASNKLLDQPPKTRKTSTIAQPIVIKEEACLRVALVCHSNLNRSMEAHNRCEKAGLDVSSFGAGNRVNLPGLSRSTPNVYEFGTPYKAIYDDLEKQDAQVYEKNGILGMLRRNIEIKARPERWQDDSRHFNLVVCFEQRIFDIVLEDIWRRSASEHRLCHVVNIETIDNLTAAIEGGQLALDLVKKLNISSNWDDKMETALDELEDKAVLNHSVVFY